MANIFERASEVIEDLHKRVDALEEDKSIDYSALAEEIDYNDLASDIDYSDLAEKIDTDQIAEAVQSNMDLDSLAEKAAEQIDYDEVVEKAVENLDMDDMAERIAGLIDMDELSEKLSDNPAMTAMSGRLDRLEKDVAYDLNNLMDRVSKLEKAASVPAPEARVSNESFSVAQRISSLEAMVSSLALKLAEAQKMNEKLSRILAAVSRAEQE